MLGVAKIAGAVEGVVRGLAMWLLSGFFLSEGVAEVGEGIGSALALVERGRVRRGGERVGVGFYIGSRGAL